MKNEEIVQAKKLIGNMKHATDLDIEWLQLKAPKGAVTVQYFKGTKIVKISLLWKIELGII